MQGRVVLLRDRVKEGRVWGKGRGVARQGRASEG